MFFYCQLFLVWYKIGLLTVLLTGYATVYTRTKGSGSKLNRFSALPDCIVKLIERPVYGMHTVWFERTNQKYLYDLFVLKGVLMGQLVKTN